MSTLLHRIRARWPLKVSVGLLALLVLTSCDRPSRPATGPQTAPEPERTRTRANTGTGSRERAAPAPVTSGPLVLSIAAGGSLIDCSAKAYHPGLQAASAAQAAELACTRDRTGLALRLRPVSDGPWISAATLAPDQRGLSLVWDDQRLSCESMRSFEILRASACDGDGIPLDGVTLRRTWP